MKHLLIGLLIGAMLALALSGCALFGKTTKSDSNKTEGIINIGDGKFLGIDIAGNIEKVFNLLPSCNENHELTAVCIIGAADGVSGSQSTVTPQDRATQEALATLGFATDPDCAKEYQCCKGIGMAVTYLVNKSAGGNLSGIAALFGLVK